MASLFTETEPPHDTCIISADATKELVLEFESDVGRSDARLLVFSLFFAKIDLKKQNKKKNGA